MRILIIDDDLGTLETMSIGLRELGGHAAATAPTGAAGIAMAASAAYDVVLIDLILPDMDGLAVMRALPGTMSASAAKYLMTGHASIATAVHAMKLGATDYLPKPLDIERLIDALSDAPTRIEAPVHGISDRRIAAVLEHISLQPTVTIDCLAGEVGLGESRLRHLFQQVVGTSLGSYLQSARLDKAAGLLRTSYRRISEIAYELGYQDVGRFIRRFRRQFGVSPSQYRRGSSSAQTSDASTRESSSKAKSTHQKPKRPIAH